MDESLNPAQITTLCVVFFGFHLLAVPAFWWAMRHRQFSGAEQRVWSLDDGETAPPVPAAPTDTRRVRWLLGTLMALGMLMLSAIALTMLMAFHAPTHPIAAGGKCPFF